MSKAIELADRFTRELPNWPAGRLPTERELALRHGASTRTVQAALDLMRQKGIVESRPRSGLWRVGDIPRTTYVSSRVCADDLGVRLKTELVEGIYPWDCPLPSIKELAVRWKCHVQTVSKSLETAIAAGLLERRGRFHFPVRPKVQRKVSSPTLLCIGAAAGDGNFRIDSDRESDFLRELGAQATLAGLSLVRLGWQGQKIQPNPSIVGAVVTTWHFQETLEVSRELSRLKIPTCAVVGEHMMEGQPRDSRLHLHDLGYSSGIGSHLARHFLELGHTHFAYISPWHSSHWSRNRLRGIEEEAVRKGGRVEAFCLGGTSEWDRLGPASSDPVLIQKFPHSTLAKMVEGPSERVLDFVSAELGWNRIREDMAPLFEQAFASGATAWIGANDFCALTAVKWLRARGVDVPKAISIAGFDDTVEALRADLTSFRFSCASMARSMIHQILSPSTSSSMTRHEGMVVVRGTTAPPP